MKMTSPAALHTWIKGERRPNDENIKKLADFFFPENLEDREKFTIEVRHALKSSSAVPDPLDELMSRQRPLRIGVVEYGLFSGEPNTFFNRLFDRFAAFASLSEVKGEKMKIKPINLNDAQRELCQTGDVDIVLGFFATPDRALSMRFFKTPLTIPLSALVDKTLRKKGYELRKICDALMKEGSEKPDHILEPIVNKNEVGGIHVRHFLHFNDDNFINVEYDEKEYAARLKNLSQDRNPKIQPIPIVIADEVMCLKVKKLGEQNGSDFEFVKHPDIASQTILPSYRLSFAVNRQHAKWAEYLTEAFNTFLESNVELVSSIYRKLFRDLLNEFNSVLDDLTKAPKEAAERLKIVSPDKSSLARTDPWSPIINKCYEIFSEEENEK